MIVAVVVLGAVLAAVLVLHDRQVRAWSKERQILLERIQAPERVTLQGPGEVKDPLETDGAALALVGAVIEGED
jgi:hypothetical protein